MGTFLCQQGLHDSKHPIPYVEDLEAVSLLYYKMARDKAQDENVASFTALNVISNDVHKSTL